MKKDGVAIISTTSVVPAIVTSSKDFEYPNNALDIMKEKCSKVISVEGDKIAAELGNLRLVNTILLGVLSTFLPFSDERWKEVIKFKVKERFIDINLKAFEAGKALKADNISV